MKSSVGFTAPIIRTIVKRVDNICLFRISAANREKLEALVFRRYPRREWGTFFQFGYRFTPWGLHVTFVDAIEPGFGELDEQSGIVEFNAAYILRAQLIAEEVALGVGVIHSHPEGCGTGASSLDNDMDAYFASEFSTYTSGRPYVSLRVAKSRGGEFRFSGEAWMNGEILPITDILTVGGTLRREYAELNLRSSTPSTTNARVGELVGEQAPKRMSLASVGVIGCSGLGSPAVHVLTRAGVRKFVLVDPDRFTDSNHERFHASKSSDLGRDAFKVELLRRMILEISPDSDVIVIRGNVLDDDVLDHLLRCDLVLGCTDTQHSRAAMSDYATHYLLPCLDAAVLMRAKKGALTEQVGEFARYTADEPCAWCLGRINQSMLWYELMPD
ncbi:MAG TPA: ThiF family adenylyltransferase, partial [Verrucomicrobiae bacterium]|nr:ThiF family adenylyltransferase [Verrucomicrobiae bacterium]